MKRHLCAVYIIVTSCIIMISGRASMEKRTCKTYKDCDVGEYCLAGSAVELSNHDRGEHKHIQDGVCTEGKLKDERCDPNILCHCGLGLDCRVPPSKTNKLLYHQHTCQQSDFARDMHQFPKRYLLLLKCEIRTKEGGDPEPPIFDR